MKYIRRSISIFLITVFLTTMMFSTARAESNTIYETSAKETITSGVTLENIVKFTEEGWQNINVLRIDLSNPSIKLDTVSDPDSLNKLSSVKNLAKSQNAVAAVNASFFNPTGGGAGYPDGPIVESGKIVSAASDYNLYGDVMGSFSIDNLDQLLYNYWKTDITLLSPNGNSTPVQQYNKPSRQNYTDFTIWDRKWGTTSPGVSETYPDITEMVVDGGKVVEIRQAQPAVQIPENGYVVITRQAGSKFLTENFQVGDSVDMSIATNPDWKNLKMSTTGGSILVKDGKIPDKFSFDIPYISKRNPRTVVGSTKDGNQLLLVTVDGRQNSGIGMTQMETAALMLKLGAHNALNLDGGGSTTMVARPLGKSDLETVNSPSDGTSRLVSSVIGIFSIAPTSPLSGLIIDTEDANVFVNTSRAFTVRGYDRYFNPVEVKPEQVTWSVSGLQGSFTGNTFHPTTVGDGKITAQIGDIKAELPISSLSAPVQLELSAKTVKIPVSQSKSLSVTGKNKNGYSAKISPEDVKWVLNGRIGQMNKNVFTASARGTGYIDASVGSTHAYCAVSVASDVTTVKDTFEQNNGSFLSYPDSVKGSYSISKKQEHGGQSSGKLTYDFSNTEGTRAAYMVYGGEGLPLDPATVKIGLWVYNDHENSNWLRAEVSDSTGKKHLVEFTRSMDWAGWKYIEASLEGISSPTKLNRLYVVQVNPIADSGSIYLDDLAVTTSGFPPIDPNKIPKDTQPVDDANKSVTYKAASDSFRFAVFGQQQEPRNPLENLLLTKLADKTNKYLEAAAFVGGGAHKVTGSVKKPFVSVNTGYKSLDIKNSRFIQLDTSKQGIRSSDPKQWSWFLQQLDSFKGNNAFICLANSPATFSDSLEADLFKDMLTKYRQKTKKNVWVFYKDSKNASFMERGVKYITSAGYELDGLTPDKTDLCKYILVVVNGSTVTFEFKPVV